MIGSHEQRPWSGIGRVASGQTIPARAAERYEALFTHNPDAVYALDRKGRISEINPTFARLSGYATEELAGRLALRLVHPRDRERAAERFRETLAGESGYYEVSATARDGRRLELGVTQVPIFEHGEVAGVYGIAKDVEDRKRAERTMRETQRRFATLLKNAPAYFYRCLNEPNWPNQYVSAYAEELTGYTPQDLTSGKVMFGDLIVEEDREQVWDEVQAALAERRRFEIHYAIRRKDGTVRHVEERGQAVYDDEGVVEAIEGVVYDITERERAEEQMREAERRYRSLVEQLPVAVYRQDLGTDGRVTYLSPQIQTISGHTSEQSLSDPTLWLRKVHPEDRERVLAEDERTERTGEPFRAEYRTVHSDGRVVWVRNEAVLVRDTDGTPLYWQGVISDETQRMEAEAQLAEAQARYRNLVETIPAAIYSQDADEDGGTTYVSPQITQLLGYEPEECLSDADHWIKILHPEDRDRVLAENERTGRTGEPFSMEYRQIAKDGRVVWIRDEAALVRDDGGRPLFWQGVMSDITERKRAEAALRESNRQIVDVLESIADAFYALDRQWRFTYVNAEAERVLQRPKEDLLGRNIWEEFPEAAGFALYPQYHRVMGRGETGVFELYYTPLERWFEVRAYPSKAGISVYFRDTTERKALEERLEYQALHDPLTKLPNRTLFVDRLKQATRRAERRGSELAVLFADLDNFKVVNDSLGHETGDRLLVAVTRRLRALLRPEDTVARLGGDEFVFLLEETDTAGAIEVAERIADELRRPFSVRGRQLFITTSIGLARGGANGKHAADLLRDADLAMYRAKHSGKARYAVFEEEMNAGALRRLELEHGLRRAIERKELAVHYQPQVRIGSGKIMGFEALVRWEHPERGLLLPDEFVPLAEETGLIVPIGEQVLEQACRQAGEWQSHNPSAAPITVCVNLSARQFREPGLTDTVARTLERTGLDPECLFLEITESTAMSDVMATAATLEELQGLGVRAIIDDFGTGYSSLSYLERFPVDYVKIDSSFVGGLAAEPGAAVLVSGVIRLMHALNLEVVAEGVETAEQLERLRVMGCDVAQGYLFSKALPAERTADLISGGKPWTTS